MDTIENQRRLQAEKIIQWKRRVPYGDLITERGQNAREYGFGHGTTMYDSVFVLGEVKVGRNCWIGPNVILDGSGGLTIGDWVCIDANCQIYSHDSSDRFVSCGTLPDKRSPTVIGNGVFIGPNCVVSMGVTIGSHVKIGVGSWVKSDVPDNSVAYGVPAKVIRSP